jgi:hypothetical protein
MRPSWPWVAQIEVEEGAEEGEEQGKGKKETKPAAAVSDFFLMMRNKSIQPPSRGLKQYPQGSKGTTRSSPTICICIYVCKCVYVYPCIYMYVNMYIYS